MPPTSPISNPSFMRSHQTGQNWQTKSKVLAKYNGGLHVQTKDSRALEVSPCLVFICFSLGASNFSHVFQQFKKQASARPLVLPKPGTLFQWAGEHMMDQRGIISFLATSGGTCTWTNPADSGVVKVDSSPWSKGRVQEVVNTLQHARADSWSEDKPGAWFSVSLPPDTPIEPTHYTVRHGYGGGAQMRNWKVMRPILPSLHFKIIRENNFSDSTLCCAASRILRRHDVDAR